MLVRPTGIEPVPPRWQRGLLLHTQAERGPGGAHRPDRHSRQLSKNPLLRAGGHHTVAIRDASICLVRQTLPLTWRVLLSRQAQNKKAF